MAGVPGESYSEPDVYSMDRDEESGDFPRCDDFPGYPPIGFWGIDIGSLGMGSFG